MVKASDGKLRKRAGDETEATQPEIEWRAEKSGTSTTTGRDAGPGDYPSFAASVTRGPNLPLAGAVVLLLILRSQLRGRGARAAILDLRKGSIRRG